MTLTQIKSAVRAHMSDDQIRAEFGDLRRRDTWEAALDKCGEFIALAADAANDAQQPAQATADAVTEVVYSDTSRAIFHAVMRFVAVVAIVLGLLSIRTAKVAWQATEPIRQRGNDRVRSEFWAAVGAWPDLLIGL